MLGDEDGRKAWLAVITRSTSWSSLLPRNLALTATACITVLAAPRVNPACADSERMPVTAAKGGFGVLEVRGL